MNQEDVDKIIAEAVADSKKQSSSKWHKGKGSNDSVLKTRKILNWAFMIGGLAAVILYFAVPDNKVLFFSVGFGAVVLKLVEFYLRFMF